MDTLSQEIRWKFVESLQYLNPSVFDSDTSLMKELVKIPKTCTKDSEKIGIILISPISMCNVCGSKLSVRADKCVQAGQTNLY